MSGSKTPLIIAGVVGGALFLALGMVAVLAGVFLLLPPSSQQVEGPAPKPEPVAVEEPEEVVDPEPEEEPPPPPEPEPLEPEVEEVAEDDGTTTDDAEEEAPEPAAKSECVPSSKGVTQLGPKKRRVTRSLIEKYTSNTSAASNLERVKLAKTKSGKTRGVRLVRVPCKSPLRAAGLQSKDLILEVDGKSVTSYAQGLRIWAAIRRKGSFTVKIRRGDGVRVHTYVLS